MLRIVSLTILPGMLLAACASWVSADTVKQKYSNRPIGYTVPTPYYGTPMAPRFVVPPVAQVRVQPSQRIETADFSRASSSVAVMPPAPLVGDKTVFVLREPAPEVNVNDELDAFYARMAKIQVEKKQLPEALALIQNIRSETFKVRTIVSLAEYVSRDKNYQSEAEQLYRLALTSIDALDKKQPFRIDTGGVRLVIPPIEPRSTTAVDVDPPPAPIPVPIDTEPVIDVQSPEQPVTPKRPPIDLDPPGDEIGLNGENGKRPPPPPPPPEGVGGSGANDGLVTSPPGNRTITPIPAEDDGPISPTPPNSTTTTRPTQDPPPASLNGITIGTPSDFVTPPVGISLDGPEETTAPPVINTKPIETVNPPKPATSSGTRRPPIILTDEN